MNTTQKHNARSLDLPRAEVSAYRNRKYLGSAKHKTIRQPEGDSIAVGNLESPSSTLLDETVDRDEYLLIQPVGFTWGSYVGSTAERSNYNTFLDRHGDKDGVYRTYGSHGAHSIAIRGDVTDEHVLEDLQAVEEYPLLDESDYSMLEMALENDALGLDHGYDDKEGIRTGYNALDEFRDALRFRIIDFFESSDELQGRALQSLDLPGDADAEDIVGRVLDALDEYPDDALRELFFEHARRGHDIIHETATDPFIDAEQVAENVSPTFILP